MGRWDWLATTAAAPPTATAPPLRIGDIEVSAPVILAPMAGVTDVPFRQVCRQFAQAAAASSAATTASEGVKLVAPVGLYVCEMITARAVVEGNEKTWRMLAPDPTDAVRSVQLYGTAPNTMRQAARAIAERDLADHIDLNFGCPVPKVTRKGGGAALPWKLDLFRDVVAAVIAGVRDTGRDLPVTVKMRTGIDEEHLTFLDAARISEDLSVAAIGLHARTQAQYYSGKAQWEAISELKQAVSIPVLGNGDIFSADNARTMMAQTGCDAVVIGRGAQGRPWLFADLITAFHNPQAAAPVSTPNAGQVAEVILLHADLMIKHLGSEAEAMRRIRKHVGWYLRGFPLGGQTRLALARVAARAELEDLLGSLDPQLPYPQRALGSRGRAGQARRPRLPDGWLQSRTLTQTEREEVAKAECEADGG